MVNMTHTHDFATGKLLPNAGPEEDVRQAYERTLHFDYGYAKEQMDIEVPIQRGSKAPKDAADIVIYRTADIQSRDQNKDITGIVETKRPRRQDGLRQLKTYMSASSALWGVWTNGTDIAYVYRDPATGALLDDYIFDIPRNGENIEDMGRFSKADLVPAQSHSLRPIFNRILQTLYSNTSTISRKERLGGEMIRLIFAKIWDERFNQHLPPEFRVGLHEDPEAVKQRVCALFDDLKSQLVGDGIFEEGDTITLDARSVTWVVGQLERYSLSKTDKDVVGEAFEVFAESKLVGEKGEFFTPREVVRLAVDLVDPKAGQLIIDPACGSGGFLIYALEHVWRAMDDDPRYRDTENLELEKQDVARRYFFGIDKEIDLVRIAKAYMAIAGDGRGGIAQENSLHAAAHFEGPAKTLFTQNDAFKQFDIVFTNPPFGADIKVLRDEAAQFDLGHRWKKVGDKYEKTDKAKDTEPQTLFIERCLEMLKPGGILAIVLPETLFHAPSYRYILQFALKGNNLKAVVDLPHNTFRPFNNAKTCLMVLQKGRPQQPQVLMAVAQEMGHDHQGQPKYRLDPATNRVTNEIWDDLEIIRKELEVPHAAENQLTFHLEHDQVQEGVYVPRYYWKNPNRAIVQPQGVEPLRVEKLLDEGVVEAFRGHGSPESAYKGQGEIPYIRVSDIVNWELYRNPTSYVPRHVMERIRGEDGVQLQPGDVVFVRRGSYRIGTVAMASAYDQDVLLTGELVVLRMRNGKNDYGIDPYYLLYLLSHDYTQAQIYQKVFIETTLPNIGERWQELELPWATDPQVRESVRKRVRSVEVGWEKWTPKSDKLERRRCQDEEGPARKVYQGIPAGSSEAGIGRESVIARGRASVVLTAIDVGVLGEAI